MSGTTSFQSTESLFHSLKKTQNVHSVWHWSSAAEHHYRRNPAPSLHLVSKKTAGPWEPLFVPLSVPFCSWSLSYWSYRPRITVSGWCVSWCYWCVGLYRKQGVKGVWEHITCCVSFWLLTLSAVEEHDTTLCISILLGVTLVVRVKHKGLRASHSSESSYSKVSSVHLEEGKSKVIYDHHYDSWTKDTKLFPNQSNCCLWISN